MRDIIEKNKVAAALLANVAVVASESAEIRNARSGLADSNLRIARREHSIVVCQTVIGNVMLSFDGTNYTLTKGTIEEEMILARGSAKVVKPVLSTLFVVENWKP